MGIHDGHRQRLRDSFKKAGLEGMSDVNALELLLFYAIPRQDTNELAHRLLDRFGSLSDVFEASVAELCEVNGVGENTAVLISLLPKLMRKSMIAQREKTVFIRSIEEAGSYLMPRFAFEDRELVLLLCLDSQKRLNGCFEVGRGAVNSVHLETRVIVETALKNKSVSVILAHNHPNSLALPSEQDIRTTEMLYHALRLIDVRLEDHLIFADGDFVSMRESNYMKYIK